VNLIGDHTDYNEGFVMPMAIQLDTHVTITTRPGHELLLRSDAVSDAITIDLSKSLRPRGDWTDYIVGVAHVLREEGYEITGAELSVASSVPQGAGLSSSAALEVAAALAFLGDERVDRLSIARWCQRAENEFVGARCGIMDQYVACFGRAGHALVIDCRTLESRAVAIPPEVAVVVSNSMVKHSIAGGEYNVRREQCEEAVRALRQALPSVRSLRDVTLLELNAHRELLSATAYRRARHVVAENTRVEEAADALHRRDFVRCGALMRESHQSLRDDYEVSAPELDVLVEIASAQPGVFGSRMTGGGFGGSTVTLAAADVADAVVNALREGYARRTGKTPEVIVCTPSAGAEERAA
jgi:galactokinase